tara:strand:+ start:1295 stop:1903 length:609 start_codon:yes stop_codon:yes gene_type:complete
MKIISFEGIEGVGKSTQINLLNEFLIDNQFSTEILREPGSTKTGELIREILLNKDNNLADETELLLMFSARSELIKKKIDTLSCDYLLLDRFYDASIAYQGYGRNLSKSFIKNLISFINCPIPNLSILLDISVKEAFSRKIKDKKDRIELSGSDFFNNVRNGYLEIAKDNNERFIIIDASKNIDEIHKDIIKKIDYDYQHGI